MVYGYSTNEEFIDKSYQLLEKLEAKGLWNKDTLVIGLDKSVRPLAYTLQKLSDLEGKEKPDMRFFNYSSHDYYFDDETNEKILKELKKSVNPKEEGGKKYKRILKPEKYKKILVLDDDVVSGGSLEEAGKLIKKTLSDSNKKIKIYFAALDSLESNLGWGKKIISASYGFPGASKDYEIGIEDKYENLKRGQIQESIPVKNKEIRKGFLTNRHQLSKDIKNYLHEKHPEKVSGKSKSKNLEKIISGIFILSFLAGLFLSSGNLTGNVVGGSGTAHKLLGIILVLVGMGGFFVYRKLK